MICIKVSGCPFCNSEKLEVLEASGVYSILCKSCNAAGPVKTTVLEAINAWECRAPSLDRVINVIQTLKCEPEDRFLLDCFKKTAIEAVKNL